MRRCLIQLVLVCALAPALAFAVKPSSSGTVALLSEVELKTPSVRLSDLLPPGVPGPLYGATAAIPLGSAPLPGSVRRISREEIEHALVNQPELLAEISIPENILIRRALHLLSQEQVAAAIRSALGNKAPLKIQLSGPVYFTGDDPGLEVTEVQFDDLRKVTRLRLWTSKEPENLPFYVTIPGPLTALKVMPAAGAVTNPAEPAGQASAVSATAAMAVPRVPRLERARPPVKAAQELVKAGVATWLVIQGSDYRLTSTVIPLQPGVLGQEIRVRDPITHKILSAQVAGPGLLTGSL